MKRTVNTITAATIDGWTITDYRGVVSSHVVAGTGMGSEFFASFSDLFGGRSKAFQKELTSIYDEALQSLEDKARIRNCNWIVGLKVDIDEISANNLQMFMITAIGTAVRASREQEEGEGEFEEDVAVSGADVAEIEVRNRVLEDLTRSEKIEDSTWQFLFEHEVPEAAVRVLDEWPANSRFPSIQEAERTKSSIKGYFATLPYETASGILYDALDGDRWLLATELINELNLGNLERTREYLTHVDREVGKRAMKTLTAHQPWYSESDRDVINRLKADVENTFPDRSTRKTTKPLLGSEREQWVCECSQSNELDYEFCSACQRDRFGFRSSDVTISKALRILEEREAALSTLFNKRGA